VHEEASFEVSEDSAESIVYKALAIAPDIITVRMSDTVMRRTRPARQPETDGGDHTWHL